VLILKVLVKMSVDKEDGQDSKIHHFSGATIVIFIALGALVLVLLFIFAKRQIMRFTLRRFVSIHVE